MKNSFEITRIIIKQHLFHCLLLTDLCLAYFKKTQAKREETDQRASDLVLVCLLIEKIQNYLKILKFRRSRPTPIEVEMDLSGILFLRFRNKIQTQMG